MNEWMNEPESLLDVKLVQVSDILATKERKK